MKHKAAVVPSGTIREFCYLPDIIDIHPNSREAGVLTVSARGPSDKNCGIIEECCKELGVPFFVAHDIPHEQLPEIYFRSKVFVQASTYENMSRTVGEALCAGCRVVATEHNMGNEWYPGLVTINPIQQDSLKSAIVYALESPDWNWMPNRTARRMTWRRTASILLNLYTECLQAFGNLEKMVGLILFI